MYNQIEMTWGAALIDRDHQYSCAPNMVVLHLTNINNSIFALLLELDQLTAATSLDW